ncbi:MAG: tetratricopeptide repeat protein, partial [Methanophagales archaeon]|nr:tetratricopeptide repeat protein [Methanophagales archaeon]
MSKRREFLIRLLLIIVLICCLTHTSCGQENDPVNVSHPSLAKSDFSQEDILNQAQRSLDRSIDLFNTVATVMALLVAVITLIVAIGGIWGYFKSRELEKCIEQAKESAKETKGYADKAKKDAEEVKPIIERLKKESEEALEGLREKATHLPSLSEPFSEDQKRLLEEYGKKIEFLEAFGVQLKPEDYLSRGNDFYQSNEYELALKAYDKAIELKPDFAEAWNNRGVALGKLGRYDEALKAHDKAIELKPDYAEAWNNRGVELGKLDRYDEALKAYDKAIELKPDYASAWYNKACAYSLKGDKENALKQLSKAIDLDAKYKEKAKSDADFKNL